MLTAGERAEPLAPKPLLRLINSPACTRCRHAQGIGHRAWGRSQITVALWPSRPHGGSGCRYGLQALHACPGFRVGGWILAAPPRKVGPCLSCPKTGTAPAPALKQASPALCPLVGTARMMLGQESCGRPERAAAGVCSLSSGRTPAA